jgi:polyisoprenoid-binding protein YceI
MKKLFFAVAAVAAMTTGAMAQKKAAPAAAAAAPTKWTLDASHSSVKFAVSHLMISETEGKFTKFDGTVSTPSPTDVTNAQINFTIDVNSVNTDSEARDAHLKKDDFFDTAKFPTMTFAGKSFTKVKGNNYMLEGDFTMHGVTKKIKIPVKFGGIGKDPYGNTKAGFKAQFVIDRTAYGMKGSTPAVGKEVNVTLNIELAQAK